MKILYYDCFSGISGDMNLGAMIDLGVPAEILISGLNSLNLEGWKLEITKEQRHGIFGTMVTVRTGETEDHHDHGLDHHHDHPHDHDSDHHHDHHHGSPEELDHIAHDMYLHGNKDEIHHHPHRNLKDIEEIINGSGLNANVREIALKIFRKIGEAEATVHNKSLYEIHFHEVGAIDSIIDIVGAAISFDYLRPEKIYFSDIELGGGTVKCAHGILPVPAPATSLILKGLPVHHGGVNFEATTPTGAAILATIGERIPSDLRYSVASTGYGIGHKENPSLPNMVRVYLAETDDKNATAHNAILVECNVDDMNPELVDYITGRLLGCGIPDVCFIPVVMKKTRPAFIIRVICEESHLPMVREILFTESTTLGLRVIPFMKETLQREFVDITTKYGTITVKKSWFDGRLVTVKPEADQCAAIAASLGIPMKEVIREAINCAS
ncbi:MAG TPA: nickel pincer cofactor biosynthesis protein LarC [Bacteroidales bacterium]|nr:nickel pincer cofactor biosynthesis protein LarC [Bacteroidales bacterium]